MPVLSYAYIIPENPRMFAGVSIEYVFPQKNTKTIRFCSRGKSGLLIVWKYTYLFRPKFHWTHQHGIYPWTEVSFSVLRHSASRLTVTHGIPD